MFSLSHTHSHYLGITIIERKKAYFLFYCVCVCLLLYSLFRQCNILALTALLGIGVVKQKAIRLIARALQNTLTHSFACLLHQQEQQMTTKTNNKKYTRATFSFGLFSWLLETSLIRAITQNRSDSVLIWFAVFLAWFVFCLTLVTVYVFLCECLNNARHWLNPN